MKRTAWVIAMVSSATWAQAVDTSALMLRGSRAEGSLALPSARLLEPGSWEVSLGYAHDGDAVRVAEPTGSVRGGAQSQQVHLIAQRDVAWVQLSFSPWSRFEFNASLPVLLGQSVNEVAGFDTPSTSSALGDFAAGARFGLLPHRAWHEQGMQWSLQAGLLAPTGGSASAFSERTTRVEGSTTVTWQSGAAWAVTGHVGYQMGRSVQVGDQLFGDRLNLGAALAYRLGPVQLSVDALSLVNLGPAAVQTQPARGSFELVGGARYFAEHFFVDLGVGVAPVDDGVTPRWRLSLAFGARGAREKQAEVDIDLDRDGVLNEQDKCPTLAEDGDGFEDADGCPDLDNDRDGVSDAHDQCPNDAEDRDGVADSDGCPESDADADGILDAQDKCPLAAEDRDGFEDDEGCPESGTVDARRSFQVHSLLEQTVFFEVGSAVIAAVELPGVRSIARTLLQQPGNVLLTGHADDQGAEARNDELSVQRAEAVKKLLIEAGVAGERIETRGAGRHEPLTTSTGFGRSLNRSVTFVWANPASR